MGCCGNARRLSPGPIAAGQRATAPVVFEYRGERYLTIFGRVTGIRYHFPGPGARVRVDARDARFLEVIRGLEVVPAMT